MNFDERWNSEAPPGYEFKGADPDVCKDVWNSQTKKPQSCCKYFGVLTPVMKWRKNYFNHYWQNVRAFKVEVTKYQEDDKE